MHKEKMRKNAVMLLKVALICSPMLLLPLVGMSLANNREINCQLTLSSAVAKGCQSQPGGERNEK